MRYYLPKQSSFSRITQKKLDETAALLNNRPRTCLGDLPNEVHAKGYSLRALNKRCT